MTVIEAIIKTLNEFNKPVNAKNISTHIIENKYCIFNGKTPEATIQSRLGDFIRNGDTRINRIKENGIYKYYLAKNEDNINTSIFISDDQNNKQIKIKNTYQERDLHKLLSTYLNNKGIFSKTIFHEKSNNKDANQIWTHPDMVGIKFLKLKTEIAENFLKTINKTDSFKLYSYELKREINNDNELKKAYFQTYSNSNWANYAYLVAFEISNNLYEEMERLNQSFGVGIIELNANPFRSKILFSAKYRELEFKTIDKLCNINENFANFLEHIENLITTDKRNYELVKNSFLNFCDDFLKTDLEFNNYCLEKNIPIEYETIDE